MTEMLPLDEPLLPGLDAGPCAARPADAGDVMALLRDSMACEAPVPQVLVGVLVDAAAALVPVVRATGGDVVLMSVRASGGEPAWQGVSAGAYRYMSAGGSWSTPRLGDADFTWGERAREVLAQLEASGWLELCAGARDHVGLVARAGGAWLVQGSLRGGSALFHAIHPETGLEAAGMQPHGESRAPATLFRSFEPIEIVGIEQFARAATAPEPAEAAWQPAIGGDEDWGADEEWDDEARAEQPGTGLGRRLLGSLFRIARRAPSGSAAEAA